MARIQDLPSATQITDTDLFVILQGGEDKNLSGEAMKQYIAGHGGISYTVLNQDYTLTINYTDGQSDTLGPIRGQPGGRGDNGISPTLQQTPTTGGTIVTMTDINGTQEFVVMNGEGSGDMLSSVYDLNGDVAAAGGIPNYMAANNAKPNLGTISLSATWTGSASPYTQIVTVSGATITANSKVDIQPDAALIAQMVEDGCTALYIVNEDGTLVAYAVGAAISAAATAQVCVTEVTA